MDLSSEDGDFEDFYDASAVVDSDDEEDEGLTLYGSVISGDDDAPGLTDEMQLNPVGLLDDHQHHERQFSQHDNNEQYDTVRRRRRGSDADVDAREEIGSLTREVTIPPFIDTEDSTSPPSTQSEAPDIDQSLLARPHFGTHDPFRGDTNDQGSSSQPQSLAQRLQQRLDERSGPKQRRSRSNQRLSSASWLLGGRSMAQQDQDIGRGDLFLDVADSSSSGEPDISVLPRHSQRTRSRSIREARRSSMPSSDRTTSSFAGMRSTPGFNTTFQHRPTDRIRPSFLNSSFTSDIDPSTADRSSAERPRRLSNFPDRSPLSPTKAADRNTSPEAIHYSRRRPSSGAASADLRTRMQIISNTDLDVPADVPESTDASSDQKQADSASIESQDPDAVWDELDDLKSRIKKLELTKASPITSAENSERPRTATTAPTTIGSSPKHERKSENVANSPQMAPAGSVSSISIGTTAESHPLLHAALAKAKPLLNPVLFRTLESTATDALQLATMTGGQNAPSKAFSSASIVTGTPTVDRSLRRKVDSMCRNLTDLCLALCEGKHETPIAPASSSPAMFDMSLPRRSSPSRKYARSSFSPAPTATTRPLSRLEARKNSILGAQALVRHDDLSFSGEQDSPTTTYLTDHQRRMNRAPSAVLRHRPGLSTDLGPRRTHNFNDETDPTIRPPSRAMTEVNAIRARLASNPNPTSSFSPADRFNPARDDRLPNPLPTDFNPTTRILRDSSPRDLTRTASFASDMRRRRGSDLPARIATASILDEENPADVSSGGVKLNSSPALPLSAGLLDRRTTSSSFAATLAAQQQQQAYLQQQRLAQVQARRGSARGIAGSGSGSGKVGDETGSGRLTSHARRATEVLPQRASSLSQRRGVFVE